MTTVLAYLTYAVILYFLMIAHTAATAVRQNGLMAQAGPRDSLPEPTPYLARARRLCANMQENMVIFGLVALAADAAGLGENSTAVLGARLFLAFRVIHAYLYLSAAKQLRPLAYFGSMVGVIMIVVALFSA